MRVLSFLYIQINILQYKLHSTILSNYNYTILRGRYQEERNDTTTPCLHETKRGQYKNITQRKQRGNKNIDEQHTSKYVVKLRVKVACNQVIAN